MAVAIFLRSVTGRCVPGYSTSTSHPWHYSIHKSKRRLEPGDEARYVLTISLQQIQRIFSEYPFPYVHCYTIAATVH